MIEIKNENEIYLSSQIKQNTIFYHLKKTEKIMKTFKNLK